MIDESASFLKKEESLERNPWNFKEACTSSKNDSIKKRKKSFSKKKIIDELASFWTKKKFVLFRKMRASRKVKKKLLEANNYWKEESFEAWKKLVNKEEVCAFSKHNSIKKKEDAFRRK